MDFKLKEGLKVGDLRDLIDPILSIDEYESKIDPDAIVVAFSTLSTVTAPADDLSMFIETGKNQVLDTEVSPGPNEKGNYMLFVEFTRNDQFMDNLERVLSSLRSLSLIKEWKYSYIGGKEEKEFTMENIKKDIRLEKKTRDVTPTKIKESVDFFTYSDLDDVRFTADDMVCFQKNNIVEVKQKIAFGDPTLVLTALNLNLAPIQLDDQSLRECRNLRHILGENWEVTKLADHFVLANSGDERVMVIK